MRLQSIFAIAIWSAGIGLALDPSRTLTQYVHRIWQVQQGLPQASIYSLLQTRDGYLWLGTQSGLARFDGVRFTSIEDIYRDVPTNLWIRSTLEDQRGAIWFGTNDVGLYRIENGKVTHYSVKEGLPSDIVQCLFSGPGGDVWACTPNGLVRFINGAGNPQIYKTTQGLPNDNIRGACVAADGTLLAGGDGSRLSVWNGSGFSQRALASIPADAGVREMLCSRDGTLWIGTNIGLIQVRNGAERLFTTKDGMVDNWIVDLSTSADGSLWIGTRNGFSRFRNGEFENFRPQDGLSQSTVFSILEDREGSLWVGTKHGLNQFVDGRAVPYTVNEGLPSNDTGPVFEDSHGTIWAGTLGAGLGRFDGRRFKATRQNLTSNEVIAMAEDSAGDLWIGTEKGLNRLRNGQVTQAVRQGLPSNDIRSLFRDHAGDLWVGTAQGAAVLRNGVFVQLVTLGGALRVPILAIGEDGANRLYFATAAGVHAFADGKISDVMQNGAPIRSVDAFFKDRDGLLWIGGTGGGLRLLDNGKIVPFLMRDGLFDNEIFGITDDDQDRLWMACSKGIFSVPRADLRQFAAGQRKKVTSTPYSPTDALRVIECKAGVQPVVTRTRDGRVWFSTIRGLIALDPKHFRRNTPPPMAVIEDVFVNGERANPESISTLPPGRKNLEFQYTGLSFVAPGRTNFRYMLEGYDHNWIQAGTRREAIYTNLPPGTFHFRVSACNPDGICNEAGSAVAFGLASHYYQRVWFLPACALAIAAAIWLIHQMRVRRLREHFSVILTERNRIARELHDTLIQGFSGITMEMQALAGTLRSTEEKRTLEEIIRDAGNCLRETRRSVAGLRSPQAGDGSSGLASAIEHATRQVTEAKDIRLRLKLGKSPAGLAPDVEYNLVRIAQEAVSNSVKHSGARNVEVALNCTSVAVQLLVKDDGSGFTRDGNGRAGHYGLIGMKERATHIGAKFDLASSPGRGTTVTVVLPSGNNNE